MPRKRIGISRKANSMLQSLQRAAAAYGIDIDRRSVVKAILKRQMRRAAVKLEKYILQLEEESRDRFRSPRKIKDVESRASSRDQRCC